MMSSLHLTVAAIVERNNRYLMVEETAHGHKVINQPAGHVEPGESHYAAVIREMQEETAWGFDPVAISGIYLWQHPTNLERFLRVVFCGTCRDQVCDQPLDDGILAAVWLTRAALLARSDELRSPMVMRAIDDYRDGQRYPVHMFQQIGVEELASRAAVVSTAA
jgi:8-oxo-dGTP pyrophosphatase MutT (NUDIX family)